MGGSYPPYDPPDGDAEAPASGRGLMPPPEESEEQQDAGTLVRSRVMEPVREQGDGLPRSPINRRIALRHKS